MKYLWCYKYDSNVEGIGVHADEAGVNVNIWLTPDDANEAPGTGGLVVYTARPAAASTAEDYNARGAQFAATFLEATDYAITAVPYRAAVVFDSTLFHKTDSF